MKLLFDENLSPRLVAALQREFPGSLHVREARLLGADDRVVWEEARQHGFAIVSKDNDFRQLSFLHGTPPKVIWLSLGDAGTDAILAFLRIRHAEIERFGQDPEASLLVLTRT